MQYYVADFETTTKEEDCRVWAYAICEVGNEENVIVGNNIADFMEWCKEQKNVTVLFHNLRFDAQFIFSYLFKNGFTHADTPADRATNTFTTLINDLGLYYAVEVIFYRKGKNIKKVTFQDSYKLLPMSVDAIAKAFDLPYKKLKIDYKAHDELPEGAPLTAEEEQYITHDVKIVAKGIEYLHSQGMDKMTIGACALAEYKRITTKKYFNLWFPVQNEWFFYDIKQSYKGGWVYLNPKFRKKIIGHGLVFDANSLYADRMKDQLLPYGTPIYYKGEYEYDKLFPLYIQTIRCAFELKKGKIPTIQLKNSLSFRGNEYITSSNEAEEVLTLTSVDLALFLEHYDVYNLQYISGWKFKGARDLFTEYIEKWSNNKIEAKEQGNAGLYTLSKQMLTSLYGKFGTGIEVRAKRPRMDEQGRVYFERGEKEKKESLYLPVASFITSYARLKTISTAQRIQDNYNNGISRAEWVYSDTDSVHILLNGEDKETFLKNCGFYVHQTELGAWKLESEFTKAKFIRQKCYMEQEIISEAEYNDGMENDTPELYSKDENGYYRKKITVAGMPSTCHGAVTFNKFRVGATFTGKKQPIIVDGGVVLKDVDFTIVE